MDVRVIEDASMPENEYGEACGKALIIKLNPLHKASYKRSLTHEVAHIALSVSGLTELLDEHMEEAIVVCIENALAEYTDFSNGES